MPVFAVFFAAYFMSQFYRTFLAVVAPILAVELKLDSGQLGVVGSAWFVVFAAAQFPVGWSLDKYGPRRTMALLMLTAVAGALVFALAPGYWATVVGMGLIGLGSSPILMGALFVFARTQPPERFTALGSSLIGFGSIGNLLSATPMSYAVEAIGWRWATGLSAIAMLGCVALVLLVVKDPPKAVAPGEKRGALAELMEVMSIRALWPLAPIIFFAYAVVAAERSLWIGPFLTEVHGLSAIGRGNGALAMGAAMIAGAFIYVPIEKWLGHPKPAALMGAALSTAMFALLWLNPRAELVPALVMLMIIGCFGSTYSILMSHGRRFIPDHLMGRGVTFLNFLSIGGAGVIQVYSGRLIGAARGAGLDPADSFARMHLIFAILMAISVFIYAFTPRFPPSSPKG